jgi:hypothetical protein
MRGRPAAWRDAYLSPRTAIDRGARRLVAGLHARIPTGSAESVALFRIVFGTLLLAIVLARPVAVESDNVTSPLHAWLLGFLSAAPWVAGAIRPWLACWGALFVAGAMARTSFAMLTLGIFAWALLYTTQVTYHTVTALLLALACLQWSRWGDAWSVDAWRRGSGARGTPQEYGYTTWVPGLVLGVVFAAAAIAKLRDSGLAWILNGTVKYHFLTDSPQAVVDWGLDLGRIHALAVLLSFMAIAIESLVIVGVLSRRYWMRLLAGLASMSILAGFSLLQGLFWPAWWILLLSFLPWHLVGAPPNGWPAAAGDAASPADPWRRLLRPAAVVAILGLFAQQAAVSLLRVEMSPLLSKYDMYSTTYGSPAEYEEKSGPSFWILATDDAGQRHECRVRASDADVITRAASGSKDGASAHDVVRRCFAPDMRVRDVSLERRRARVDWAQWRMTEPARDRLVGPADFP